MVNIRTYLFIALSFSFVSCTPDPESQKIVSSLDSLNGALTVLCEVLNTYDSISVKNTQKTYEAYRVFIKYKTEDTLQPEEALSLKKFFRSAQQIESFQLNKPVLLQRCVLMKTQVSNLKQDALNDLHGTELMTQFLHRELEAGKEITQQIFSQRNSLETAMKDFTETKVAVEIYLRSKNEGRLPLTVSQNSPL